MKHYSVIRTPEGVTAEVIDSSHPNGGYPLDPRYDMRNHSPAGYEMGYSGSGPSQLSLALLADALGDDERSLALYQRFKARVIAPIEGDRFEISQEEIRQIVHQLDQERSASWAVRTQPIHIGDRVCYSATFLRSIGELTGDMPQARGTVTELVTIGKDTVLAEIAWDGQPVDIPERVNVRNLSRCTERGILD